MNGHVFQCYDETKNRNQFERTIEALGRYAAEYFSNARDVKAMLKALREVEFIEPEDPPFSSTRTTVKIWEREVELFIDRKANYDENKWSLYAVIIGQCSPSLKSRLKGNTSFENWDNTHDCVAVLKESKLRHLEPIRQQRLFSGVIPFNETVSFQSQTRF